MALKKDMNKDRKKILETKTAKDEESQQKKAQDRNSSLDKTSKVFSSKVNQTHKSEKQIKNKDFTETNKKKTKSFDHSNKVENRRKFDKKENIHNYNDENKKRFKNNQIKKNYKKDNDFNRAHRNYHKKDINKRKEYFNQKQNINHENDNQAINKFNKDNYRSRNRENENNHNKINENKKKFDNEELKPMSVNLNNSEDNFDEISITITENSNSFKKQQKKTNKKFHKDDLKQRKNLKDSNSIEKINNNPPKDNLNNKKDLNTVEKKINHENDNYKNKKVEKKPHKLEREFIKIGSKKDKINALTLIINKDPQNSQEELSDLIDMCTNSRSDFAFLILQNLKDLINENLDLTKRYEERKRITNLFKNYLSNEHIKEKVTSLVYDLLKKGNLYEDLIYSFVNKLGDNSNLQKRVEKYLQYLYSNEKNRESINQAIEDIYEKDINVRKKIVGFLNRIRHLGHSNSSIYMKFLENTNQKNFTDISLYEKTLENIVHGLSLCDDKTELENLDISKLLFVFNNNNLNLAVIKLLDFLEVDKIYIYLQKLIKSLKMIDCNKISNVVYTIRKLVSNKSKNMENINLLSFMLNIAIFYDIKFVLSILMITYEYFKTAENVNLEIISACSPYVNHYNPLISMLARRILSRGKFYLFNAYNDEDYLKNLKIVENRISKFSSNTKECQKDVSSAIKI